MKNKTRKWHTLQEQIDEGRRLYGDKYDIYSLASWYIIPGYIYALNFLPREHKVIKEYERWIDSNWNKIPTFEHEEHPTAFIREEDDLKKRVDEALDYQNMVIKSEYSKPLISLILSSAACYPGQEYPDWLSKQLRELASYILTSCRLKRDEIKIFMDKVKNRREKARFNYLYPCMELIYKYQLKPENMEIYLEDITELKRYFDDIIRYIEFEEEKDDIIAQYEYGGGYY